MYRPVAIWLFTCCFMVFMTAQIGAVTRLTESGLSITEWKPLAGALPPLNEAAWRHAFDLYRQSPEFAAKHFWMNLNDFKHIFFWEWLHRLWDRMIGVAFLLPFLWFWHKKQLPPGFSKLLLVIFAVGCAEGFMGWYMVQSGLIDHQQHHFGGTPLYPHRQGDLRIRAGQRWRINEQGLG